MTFPECQDNTQGNSKHVAAKDPSTKGIRVVVSVCVDSWRPFRYSLQNALSTKVPVCLRFPESFVNTWEHACIRRVSDITHGEKKFTRLNGPFPDGWPVGNLPECLSYFLVFPRELSRSW